MNDNVFTLGSNHQDTKMRNRALVLKMICTNTNISRIDISRLTGLSKMSITNIVNELIRDGFVTQQDEHYEVKENAPSGRRPVFISPSTNNYFALGVYISRDFAIATISNLRCEGLFELRSSFNFEESESSFKSKIKKLIEKIIVVSQITRQSILGIGVACIGPLDVKNGIILEPPNFHKLKSIHIKEFLEEELNLKVFVDNDMNASALAEKLFGKGRNVNNFVYVGVTNGIGAGVVSGNAIFKGDMGFGGEIGHISINFEGPKCPCGNVGCLELYASIPEIVTQARNSVSLGMNSMLKELDIIEWEDIIKCAVLGDTLAVNLVDRLCLYISIGLVSLSNIFDPEVIYLGHEIALAGELVRDNLEANINQKIFSSKYKKIPVAISTFNDKAPVAGSTAIVLNNLFNSELVPFNT
jgi:predicted NBD/HSP70 family sugar kinase